MAILALLIVAVGLLVLLVSLGAKANGVRLAGAVLLVAGGALMAVSVLAVVPAGHVGVVVLFGKVRDKPLPEGLHVVNPFAEVEAMSIRTQTYTMSVAHGEGQRMGRDAIDALSKDGLRMPLDVTVAYRLIASDGAWVFRNLGQDYAEVIIRASTRTAIREAAAEFSAQEAYSSRRAALADRMQELLVKRIEAILSQYDGFAGKGFVIQQVMLRNVSLPDRVRSAIEEKLAADQEAQRMEFVLVKEAKEAERKQIEAQGIAEFQRIVSEGIDERLLRWKGIEATLKVAESPNAKVIIIGGAGDGLPVILNTSETGGGK